MRLKMIPNMSPEDMTDEELCNHAIRIAKIQRDDYLLFLAWELNDMIFLEKNSTETRNKILDILL